MIPEINQRRKMIMNAGLKILVMAVIWFALVTPLEAQEVVVLADLDETIAWIEEQDLPGEFHFHPYGLAGRDGEISFAEPAEPGIHSLFAMNSEGGTAEGLKQHVLPVQRLATILKTLGHSKIDILKMDIEGAEYEVIDDIIALPEPVPQVLIEFHHRFPHIGTKRTRQAISKLNRAGYRIFHVSATGEEYSFMKTAN